MPSGSHTLFAALAFLSPSRVLSLEYQNIEKQQQLDRELVRAGSLLHDVSKTASILAKEMEKEGRKVDRVPHDVMGGRVLRARGLPERLAQVVEEHGHIDRSKYRATGPLTESELVCYADKRVTGDKVVTLAYRKAGLLLLLKRTCVSLHFTRSLLTDLKIRYSSLQEWMNNAFVLFEDVERKINRDLVCGDVELVLAPLLARDLPPPGTPQPRHQRPRL